MCTFTSSTDAFSSTFPLSAVAFILTYFARIKQLVHVIRAEVHNTRNIWQDVKRWWKGLSLKMSAVCATMKVLRAEISVSDTHPSTDCTAHLPTHWQGRCSDAAVGAKNEDTALLEASFKQLSSQRGMYTNIRHYRAYSSLNPLPQPRTHSVVWKNFLRMPNTLPRPRSHVSSPLPISSRRANAQRIFRHSARKITIDCGQNGAARLVKSCYDLVESSLPV